MHAIYDKTAAMVLISASGSTGLVQGSPGLLSIHWPFALALIAATGAVLAVFLARHFK